MPVPLPNWLKHAGEAIRRLAERPHTLFFLLLALNALSRPCSITGHDARLYSLQALNAATDGAYADDVFLRYGSQDQFTLFSHAVGPLVSLLGLRTAFFLLYLVFNTLFILALFLLVRTLIADRLISTLALVYLVTASLFYGGHAIFTVHEQFFTPRVIGTTCTLFALERMLRGRYVQALVLLVFGSLMHPLMAFGGILIWAGDVALRFLPRRIFGGLLFASLLGAALVLGLPALGMRVFGEMDGEWHRLIRIAVDYNYPDTWPLKDWLNVAVSFGLTIAASALLFRDDPDRRRLFLAVTLAGAVGLAATVAAAYLPYALLFQAQPYRVLWILRVVQVPLGFLLIARWSAASSVWAQIAALGLVAFFCVMHYIAPEFVLFAVAVPISLAVNHLSGGGEPAGRWWYAIARGCVLGALGWMIYRCWFFFTQRTVLTEHLDLDEWMMLGLISPIFCLVVFCLAAGWRERSLFGVAALRWAPAAIALLTPATLFAAEASPRYRHEHARLGADMAFLRDFVQSREASSRRPCVYCPLGRADLLWIDVGATSYFDILQTAGVIFKRETALEIDRRCELVARFEMHRQRQEAMFLNAGRKVALERLFQIALDSPEPDEADLVRLCSEPGLDYVAIPQEFPGLYSATNGRIFIYECRRIGTGGR